MIHDEQPWRKIDRKQAFGQSTSAPEVQDTHPESAQPEEVQDAQPEHAQLEEVQDKEADIDQDYNLTQSPFNPIDDYLGSEQETALATGNQPMVNDPIPRYLLHLVPTKKGVTPENPATEAPLEQSSSSGTSSSSESNDGDDDVAQEQADEEYLEQMEVNYKGTEGTQEDISRVLEVYHPITHIEEDQLLSGKVMDAFPRTESTLLADSVQAAAETGSRGITGILRRNESPDTQSIHNQGKPTPAEDRAVTC